MRERTDSERLDWRAFAVYVLGEEFVASHTVEECQRHHTEQRVREETEAIERAVLDGMRRENALLDRITADLWTGIATTIANNRRTDA